MYFSNDSQDVDLDEDGYSSWSCSQGHRSSLNLQTPEGGSICLVCFSNLVSNPLSPTIHVSYALSQLSRSISHPPFLHSILTFNPHFLVSPLVNALSSFDDEPIAEQLINLILALSASADPSVCHEFVARVSDRLSSGALGWSSRQLHMLHCLGVLLNCEKDDDLHAHIKDMYSLIFILVTGLQLPSEEIRGEVLFVLYKLSVLQSTLAEGDGRDMLIPFCPKLLYLLADVLMKTQNDDVRLNCIALLTLLARRNLLREECAYDTCNISSSGGVNSKEIEDGTKGSSLVNVFAEAIKGPLLSSNSQVQIGTLDLLFHYLSSVGTSGNQIRVLLEENIADYLFEILRLSEYKDPEVKMCLHVLDLLSTAEEAFKLRLVVGFSTLIPVLSYVAEVPFHPVQCETLKLIHECISECPGAVSTSQLEELVLVLTRMLRKHSDGEMGMIPETFIMACSAFVALIRSPSCNGALDLSKSIEEAMKHAILACLYVSERDINKILQCLYLLKEAYAYSHDGDSTNSSKLELRSCILDICQTHLLPWVVTCINEMEEEIVLGLLEIFHSILLLHSSVDTIEFAETLISSCWFSFSYGCLGLFTGHRMKQRIYLLLSSLMDSLLGNDSGHPIRDAALHLPSDPVDLLFLLGQRSTNSLDLLSCQSAVLLIMYTSSLYDERLADEKLVLASLEQYILLNNSDFHNQTTDNLTVTRLVNLYSLLRGLGNMSYQIHYSREAEEIIFQLINNDEWYLLSARIHTVSLKWLFKQENIIKSLCHQILKFCRSYNLEGADKIIGNNNQTINVQTLAELVSTEDNYGARLFVCLLTQLFEEEGQEHDIISVLNLMATIVHVCPAASDQLSLYGIGSALRAWCYLSNTFSTTTFMSILNLVFNTLSSVHPETLSADQSWVAVTMKMMEYSIPPQKADTLSYESLFVIGILSLILHLSTKKALEEASKPILFNTCIITVVNTVVCAASSKGPALVDHDEGTSTGEALILVLLLHFFAVKSLHAILPGFVDWQNFLVSTSPAEPLAFIGIRCHDLCKLLHFGSPLIKVTASYSLLELFNRISEQINSKHEELKCTVGYLMSIRSVLEGLVFYNDLRVATNCALCLSMLLGWEELAKETKVLGKSSWCRLITEEMTVSLAAPALASQSCINSQRPAVHIAIALLKLHKIPQWMRSVFNNSCISGILENLAASNLSSEILVLFRELLKSDFLSSEQIATINQILQECRKRIYTNNAQEGLPNEPIKKVLTTPCDLGDVCRYLIDLISSETYLDMVSWGFHMGSNRLLEEIELFFSTLTVDDDS
ncbi:protein PUTATIVE RECOMBINATION INITIATION DEFECT 1 [Gastrolobium bilobum]|uniref:protein PUTATIVE RECOMBINATION INITIATION DEFECT 1 n=1 Tax=Gastrolobium bilobum TaxID=150636 RepID=UPI002AAFC61C|nr:protein PUTATIVE RECOMBINATION INITIATION DEFECT 1 [Gastrolobium bilobum]